MQPYRAKTFEGEFYSHEQLFAIASMIFITALKLYHGFDSFILFYQAMSLHYSWSTLCHAAPAIDYYKVLIRAPRSYTNKIQAFTTHQKLLPSV